MFLGELNELFRENWSKFLTAGYLDTSTEKTSASASNNFDYKQCTFLRKKRHPTGLPKSLLLHGKRKLFAFKISMTYLFFNAIFSNRSNEKLSRIAELPRLRSKVLFYVLT